MRKMKNLDSVDDKDNGIVIKDNKYPEYLKIPFNKKEKNLLNKTELIKFIKNIESQIRQSVDYKAYIAYLKNDVGLRRCCLFPNIDDSKADIEMHHGPIFTLFDYVEISIKYIFQTENYVNSFRVVEQVLKDHWDNIVQVVMLSEMAHKSVHASSQDKRTVNTPFISIDSAFGDLTKYIKKYSSCIEYTHIKRIKFYMKQYEEYNNNKKKSREDIFIRNIKKWNSLLESPKLLGENKS